MLSPAEQKELMDVAWGSIRRTICREGDEQSQEQPKGFDSESVLSQPAGAFVSLYNNGELRGCLGLIVSETSLAETVSQLAGRSATEDPRFLAVTENELDDIQVEISVLSPLREISSIEEIQVGKHGLFIVA